MHYVLRALRSFALGLIMFLSVKALGFTPAQASLAAAIPFILGVIDVMAGTAFSMTGCVFIMAVLAHVFPAEFLIIKNLTSSVVNEAGSALVVSGTAPATPEPNPQVISVPSAPASSPAAPAPITPASTPAPIPAPAAPVNPPPVVSSSNASTTGSAAPK
jgi:hypothetical protein